jgi:hypothetical protein
MCRAAHCDVPRGTFKFAAPPTFAVTADGCAITHFPPRRLGGVAGKIF